LKSVKDGTFDLDLSARARDFIAINALRKPERIIYGTGIMDLNVVIEGNSKQPSIQGNASLEKGSNLILHDSTKKTIMPKKETTSLHL
jgi:hypothetical protein